MAEERERALREERKRRILSDPRGRMGRIVGLAQTPDSSPDASRSASLAHGDAHRLSTATVVTPAEPSAQTEASAPQDRAAPSTVTVDAPPASRPTSSAQSSSSSPAPEPPAKSTSPAPSTAPFPSYPAPAAPAPFVPAASYTRTRPAPAPRASPVSLYRFLYVAILVAASALAGLGLVRFLPMFLLLAVHHLLTQWRAGALSLSFSLPSRSGGLASLMALVPQLMAVYRIVRALLDDMFICLFVAVLCAETSFHLRSPAGAIKEEL